MQTIGHMPSRIEGETLLTGTIDVVSAYLRHSSVPTEWIEGMIKSVHSTLVEVAEETAFVGYNLEGINFNDVLTAASARFGVDSLSLKTPAQASPLRAETLPETRRRIEAPLVEAQPELPLVPSETSPTPAASRPESPASARSGKGATKAGKAPARDKARDNVTKSVRMNAILCLEDGSRVTDLAAHLFEVHEMSPEEYRAKWGLPDSYPMHAPASTLKRGAQFEIDPVTKAVIPLQA